MKTILSILLLLPISSYSQQVIIADKNEEGKVANVVDKPEDTKPKPIFMYVSQMPQPPYDLMDYLNENIKYPEEAKKNGILGKVVLKFVVTEIGEIEDVKLVKYRSWLR